MKSLVALVLSLAVVAACSSDGTIPPPDASSDGPTPDGASGDAAADASVDVVLDAPADGSEPADSGGSCGPTWTPTQCGNCGGQSSGTTCNQSCVASSCGDGKAYAAQCDLSKGTCDCYIDQVKVCSCTITKPANPNGCEPESYGGVMCCWNVG